MQALTVRPESIKWEPGRIPDFAPDTVTYARRSNVCPLPSPPASLCSQPFFALALTFSRRCLSPVRVDSTVMVSCAAANSAGRDHCSGPSHKSHPRRLNATGNWICAGTRRIHGECLARAALLGAVVGGGIVFLIAVVSRGAVGGGDIKLMAMLGAVLGWKGALAVLAFSQVAAALVAVGLLIAQRAGRRDVLPVERSFPFWARSCSSADLELPSFRGQMRGHGRNFPDFIFLTRRRAINHLLLFYFPKSRFRRSSSAQHVAPSLIRNPWSAIPDRRASEKQDSREVKV